MSVERLHKIIAEAGVTSRRKAELLIREGRVKVNGRVVSEVGTSVDPEQCSVTVDGRQLRLPRNKTTILLYKPTGYITSVVDPLGRPTVLDLVKGVEARLFPVGRLDYDAEGLLLLTNDGEFANVLLHPRYQVARTYLVKVKGQPSAESIQRLRSGIPLPDGKTMPARVSFVEATRNNSWIRITVSEGRNRLIKRMFEAVGHRVLKLKRIQFGPFTVGSLKPGEYRILAPDEVKKRMAKKDRSRS
ncbi:MAG TPA: pseudouridine synthase [Thermodesulfobacteriota bacterium]|nr:pseudouridine synthase [Thermodesulfobacteriota bacterium]